MCNLIYFTQVFFRLTYILLTLFLALSLSFAHATSSASQRLHEAQKRASPAPREGLLRAKEALALAQESKETTIQVNALMLLGEIESTLKNNTSAIHYFESAVQQLKGTDDSDLHVLAFSYLASLYRDIKKFDLSLKASHQSVDFSKKSNNNYLKFRAYTSQGNSYKNVKKHKEALESFKEALKYANILNKNEYKMKTYTNLAQAYKRLEDVESSLLFNKKALSLSELTGNLEDMALYLEYISTDQRKLGFYSQALPNAMRALSVQRKKKNNYRISILLMNIAIIYRRLGDYDKALAYASELITLQEKENNIKGMASAYNSLGLIYNKINRLHESKKYYQMTLALPSKESGKKNRASALRNLANVHLSQGNYNKALTLALEAKSIYKKINSLSGAESTSRMIGNIYHKNGDVHKADTAFNTSLDLARQLKNLWSEAATLIQLSKLYKDKTPIKSIQYAEQGITISKKIQSHSLTIEGHQVLMEAYKNNGDFKKAYHYSTINFDLLDQINSTEIKKRAEELKIMAILEKQEKEVEDLRREAKIQQLQIQNTSSILIVANNEHTISKLNLQKLRHTHILLIGISALFFIAILFLLNRYWQTRKDQEILNNKNKLIAEKNKELISINTTKDRFFCIISQDLRGPISSLVSLSEVLDDNFDRYNQKQRHKYIHDIYQSAYQSYNLLNTLLDWAIEQLRNTTPTPQKYSTAHTCGPIITELQANANNKNISFKTHINPNSYFYADKKMITIVLRNLIENTLKATPSGGKIKISSKNNASTTTIKITNACISHEEKNQSNVVNICKPLKQKKVKDDLTDTLGLSLCKDLVKKNGGHIFALHAAHESYFSIELPN